MRGPSRLTLGAAASLGLHGLLLVVLIRLAPVEPPQPVDEVVAFELVEPPPAPEPPPPPPPEPEPVQAPPTPPPPRPKPPSRPRPPPPETPPEPPPEAPPPANQPAPEDAPQKKVPLVTGLSMSSTVAKGQGSGMKVGVGNTLYGTPEDTARAPEEAPAYQGSERYVPPHRVTRLPEVVQEVKARYPAAARRAGIEGRVRLRVTVDAEGRVTAVEVLEGAGHGLDEAAVEALKRFRFRPGRVDDEAVATRVDYTYTFLLD